MLFLARFLGERKTAGSPRLSKTAREATVAHLKREAASRVDPERAAQIAREKLARLGLEVAR